jgi:hypothetical protein
VRARRFRRVLLADLPVKIICLTAAVILLLFHRVTTLAERFFSVPLEVSTPAGLAVASSFPKTVKITLRGAEESIFPILEEDVEASVSLDSHKSAGIYRAEVKILRKGTAQNVEPLEINVEPHEITFTLEPLVERRVPLVADLRGAPAYGFELVQSALTPQNVVIRGARSRVQGVSSLSTEEIDLTGRTGSFAARVKVLLPSALVRIAGEAAADFRATIQESIVKRSIDGVSLAAQDLSPRFAVKVALPPGGITIQGSQLAVDAVRADQARLLVECSTVHRAGQYTLRVRPEALPSVMVLDWSPRELTVDVAASGR